MTAVPQESLASVHEFPKNIFFFRQLEVSNDSIVKENNLSKLLKDATLYLPFVAKTLDKYHTEIENDLDNLASKLLEKDVLSSLESTFLNIYTEVEDSYNLLKSYFKDVLFAKIRLEEQLKNNSFDEKDIHVLVDFADLCEMTLTFKENFIRAYMRCSSLL